MARITPLQKKIFENHIEAWKNNSFTDPKEFETISDIQSKFREGKTSKVLWDRLVTSHVSITSQIAMRGHKYLSKIATKNLRKAFKETLNHLEIK